MRCDFVNYDDPDYFTANPHVQTGLKPANLVWAFTTETREQLASADVAVPDAGRGIVWQRSVRSALHESFVARRQHGAAFSVAPAFDGGDLAERVRGGAVCLASVARGIGGVDFGTQGRSEHVLRTAVTVGLCALCAECDRWQESGDTIGVRPVTCHMSRVTLSTGWHCCSSPSV